MTITSTEWQRIINHMVEINSAARSLYPIPCKFSLSMTTDCIRDQRLGLSSHLGILLEHSLCNLFLAWLSVTRSSNQTGPYAQKLRRKFSILHLVPGLEVPSWRTQSTRTRNNEPGVIYQRPQNHSNRFQIYSSLPQVIHDDHPVCSLCESNNHWCAVFGYTEQTAVHQCKTTQPLNGLPIGPTNPHGSTLTTGSRKPWGVRCSRKGIIVIITGDYDLLCFAATPLPTLSQPCTQTVINTSVGGSS